MAQHKLTARRVTTVRKPGYYGDGGNLYLQVAQPRHQNLDFPLWRGTAEPEKWA